MRWETKQELILEEGDIAYCRDELLRIKKELDFIRNIVPSDIRKKRTTKLIKEALETMGGFLECERLVDDIADSWNMLEEME